jgi:hypothetical protein
MGQIKSYVNDPPFFMVRSTLINKWGRFVWIHDRHDPERAILIRVQDVGYAIRE